MKQDGIPENGELAWPVGSPVSVILVFGDGRQCGLRNAALLLQRGWGQLFWPGEYEAENPGDFGETVHHGISEIRGAGPSAGLDWHHCLPKNFCAASLRDWTCNFS